MFKINDFWKIFEYLYTSKQDQRVNDNFDLDSLDKNIKSIALSEYSKSNKLFENTIDQIPFSSSDYSRLRSFLINWYAVNKTLVKLQNESLDLFSTTNENLDELFKSFGFNYSYSIRDFETKVNFFLDLVNIYKIKGTPTALRRVLSYYGMTDIVLLEYFLQYDKENNLIFKPRPSVGDLNFKNLDLELSPLYFEDLTSLDPHWFQSKSDINQLFQQNKINLPSKTPYFGIRPIYEFKSIEPVLAYFHRIIYDNIKLFKTDNITQERDIFVDKLNMMVSITELYLGAIYCFNKAYGYSTALDHNYIINNTDITDDYSEFKDVYKNILSNINNREDIPGRLEDYYDKLTRPLSDFFLENIDSSIKLLKLMNKEFHDEIIVWETSGRLNELTPYLINSLNTWLEDNIDVSFPDLTVLTLGFDGLLDTKDIIDFFTPKRARFLTLDILYKFESRVFDTLLFNTDNFLVSEIVNTFREFGRADKTSYCDIPHQEMIYDCSYLFDAGIVDDDTIMEFQQKIQNEDGERIYESICEQNQNIDIYQNKEVPEKIESIGITHNFQHFDEEEMTFDDRSNCYQEAVIIDVYEVV